MGLRTSSPSRHFNPFMARCTSSSLPRLYIVSQLLSLKVNAPLQSPTYRGIQILNIHSGFDNMCGFNVLSHVHYWTSYCRTRRCRPLSGCFKHNQSSRAAEETTDVHGCGGQCLRHRNECGPAAWRSVHAGQHLEVVLLDVCTMQSHLCIISLTNIPEMYLSASSFWSHSVSSSGSKTPTTKTAGYHSPLNCRPWIQLAVSCS